MNLDFKLSKTAAAPLHEQLTNALRESAARLVPGTRFASENAICRKYGLSRLTVARALNALVSEGYLKRVQGSGTFVDNPMPMHIYFLLPCIEAIKYPGASAVMHSYAGALACAARLGCRIETVIASPTNISWEVNRELIAALPSGSRLIVCGAWFRDLFETIHQCRHRVVYIDMQAETANCYRQWLAEWPQIVIDRQQSIIDLIAELAARGKRRIALLHNFSHCRNPFLLGYHEGLRRHHLADTPDLLVHSDATEQVAQYEFLHLLGFRDEQPFDTVITANNDQARGVIVQLRRNGIATPEEVTVASLNMTLEAPGAAPFIQLSLPFQEAGEHAVEFFHNNEDRKVILQARIEFPAEAGVTNHPMSNKNPLKGEIK